ncbi:MAG: hypothetical protein M3Z16_00940 [Pseudomonadota bacterium]|nr:hypothetical protein [Pseudomonadota bacterium]
MSLIEKLVGRMRARLGALLVLTLLVGIASPATAAKSTHSKADVLSQASEIAEQLSENASTIDAAAFAKSMTDLGALNARLHASLAPDRHKTLDAFVAGMRDAWTAKDRSALAVQSIEAYRLLQEALPRGPRAVPVQVAQLDYVGFKVNALLASSSTNWSQVADTVREAQAWWSAIEPQTSDATLKEAMNRTLLGMKEASDQKDAKVMHFAADMELILVDGLETFFLAHPHLRSPGASPQDKRTR